MKYFILIIICMMSIKLNAQNTDSQKNKQWEVGTDLRPIIDNNYKNYNTFFRKNLTKTKAGKTKNIGHRYDMIIHRGWLSNTRTETHLAIGMGKEWQYTVNKLKIYYGIDAGFQFGYSDYNLDKYYYQYEFDIKTTPFIGAKYQLLKGVFLNCESGLGITYQHWYISQTHRDTWQPATLPIYRLFFSINI